MIKLSFLLLLGLFLYCCETKSIQKLDDDDKRPIWFNETIPSSAFGQSGFGGTWISGKEFTYTVSNNLTKYDVTDNSQETLLSSSFRSRWRSPSFRLSSDRQQILIRYDARQIFRHSTVARFSVVYFTDLATEYKVANGEEIQICNFEPNGNSIIYILDNTIYYATEDMIKSGSFVQISDDGEPGVIYHGIPDWVYEEEMLGSDAAAWYSPDGKYLAYASFNDTLVPDFTYEIYQDGKDKYLYPEEIHLRYPKVGENNPIVALTFKDLSVISSSLVSLMIPTSDFGPDHLLGDVFWVSNSKLGAFWLNRRQNKAIFVTYSPPQSAYTIVMEMSEPDGWIDINSPKCNDGICIFISNKDNWPSLTRVDTNTNAVEYLTSNKHVLTYYGSRNGKLYYLSTPSPDESFNRHAYEFDYTSKTEKCLTCDEKTVELNQCSYATCSFSTDLSHYAMTCSGPDPSSTKIYRTDDREVLRVWQENLPLRQRLNNYHLPRTEIFHVPVEGGFNAAVKMLIPTEINFDNPSANTKKYPLLVRVYAGPGSVRIANTFSIGYQSYQVTTKKMIYVEIDGRGTGQKGLDMMFSVNNRLGTYEMDDQIAVTKHLINKYPFIDATRIAIWGWSYGGYATAMTLAKDTQNVFKCGIAVAPVTSWIFYDTIYTERYMGYHPYAANYNNSDVSTDNHIKVIGKHDFFLIHGNADDNVHYQQSMVLARALEKADIMFEQLSYPDEAHSLSGVSLHLYHSFDRFWDKCFNL